MTADRIVPLLTAVLCLTLGVHVIWAVGPLRFVQPSEVYMPPRDQPHEWMRLTRVEKRQIVSELVSRGYDRGAVMLEYGWTEESLREPMPTPAPWPWERKASR